MTQNKKTLEKAKKDAQRKAHYIQKTFNSVNGKKALQTLREEFNVNSKMTGGSYHETTVRAAQMEVFLFIDEIMKRDLSNGS